MDDKDIYSGSGYVPLHEKLPDEAPAEDAPQTEQDTVRPVYDAFMYEPIGFEEPEKSSFDENGKKDKKRGRNGSPAALLFALLIAASVGIAGFGIGRDIANSKEAIRKLSEQDSVVLYRSSKP